MKAIEKTEYKGNAKMIAAIARNESANYSSNVFKKCNNPFGLKTFAVTGCKAPVSEDPPKTPLYYMQFRNMQDAANAFVKWCKKKGVKPGQNDIEFLYNLKRAGYATDPKYVQKVLNIYAGI